mmetsp:Transcript_32009/g.38751  ORF Transcript_32009/g.38751 Transcript_32009/m.38751 type:complete len:300 (-) Transcript_32009:278-1177(-)|eukprot:CAMPEP_0197868806 /NCGR_PEP_ID=MMETSP1438-20131217/45480_1 /TAXON_ID=1461541 /ORGANISM="Pterosperma sp., Strain CCMP1384" /LENGTH=299 /DNA_ID=CAMNT_0043487535 /DNA_START=152 /DNA_END=1051 /DNA_ORIENTATION=+
MEDEDLYGEDTLYSDDKMDVKVEAQPEPSSVTTQSTTVVEDGPKTVDAGSLQAQLAEKDAQIASLQAEVSAANTALAQWRNAFRDEAKDPGTVVDNLLALRASQRKLQEQVRDYNKRENGILLRLQAKEAENLELKSSLQDMKQIHQPPNAEVHKLMLDPAVHQEFLRLQAEVEEGKKALKAANEELESVKYTAESKNGRRLRARLQFWQKENEELATHVSEGRLHRLECEIALLRDYLNDLKTIDHDLLEDSQLLDEESADIQHFLYSIGNPSKPDQTSGKRGSDHSSKRSSKHSRKN